MKTVYLNVLGGPGTGKSIITAELYAKLKRRMVLAEMVQEVVKWKIYEGVVDVDDQLSLTKEQAEKLKFLKGKVEVAIGDGNLITNAFYNWSVNHNSDKAEVRKVIDEAMNLLKNHLNIFLVRDPGAEFESKNRFQSRAEAAEVDSSYLSFLKANNYPYILVQVTPDGLEIDVLVKYLQKNLNRFASGEVELDVFYKELKAIL